MGHGGGHTATGLGWLRSDASDDELLLLLMWADSYNASGYIYTVATIGRAVSTVGRVVQ